MKAKYKTLFLLFNIIFLVACADTKKESNNIEHLAGNDEVADYMKSFEGRGALTDNSEPTPPEDALKEFRYPTDLVLNLVLAEPKVRQPVELNFDHRGRLWVVQYSQYPYPKGLKIMGMDNHLRIKYDKIPDPPPNGISGADKITFFEDTNGDGIFDKATDAITGLNIATSVTFGRGKIWVLNPPYLLAYPDKKGDGIPDGSPKVHLDGFGMEDTHAVANSLRWGPDGWLYGATGSTVTANISSEVSKNIRFKGQSIWRYHPERKIFEIFAEGGGNTFHVEIDKKGRIYSGDNGSSRGPYYKQGAYYGKNWGKHGPLTNPYAFGNLANMELEGDDTRFTHAWIKYEGGTLPTQYQGRMFAINPLQNFIQLSEFENNGSTFKVTDQSRILETDDQWFRPVDIKAGPDGAIYMADWFDSRLSHVDPNDTWHKNSGRVYRLRGQKHTNAPKFDISTYSNEQLIELLSHPNKWYRQQALRQFGDRKDKAVLHPLKDILIEQEGQLALEALWAIHISGFLDDEITQIGLAHVDPFVRMWSVRLSCDLRDVSTKVANKITELARTELNLEVRSQIACSAKRISGVAAFPIIKGLMVSENDASDPDIPLLIWWALESKVADHSDLILELFENLSLWEKPMVKENILERLMHRLVLADRSENLQAATRLFQLAPSNEHAKLLWNGLQEGMLGKDMSELPVDLVVAINPYMDGFGNGPLTFSIHQGNKNAIEKSLRVIESQQENLDDRLSYIKLLGELKIAKATPVLLKIIEGNQYRASVREAAIRTLSNFEDKEIGIRVAEAYPNKLRANLDLRNAAQDLFTSRASWAREFLKLIKITKQVSFDDVPIQIVQQFQLLGDPNISETIKKLWPAVRPISSSDKKERIKKIASVLSSGAGNQKSGNKLFQNLCASCHRLFNEGGVLGPDLTGYDRNNVDYLLFHIIDPNADIREGYVNYQIIKKDGRTMVGTITDRSGETITIRSYSGEEIIVSTDQIEKMQAQTTSLMPERILSTLSDQQIRDLFSYIMKTTQN